MQLDHTRVAIRERNMLDICDLAAQVIRDQSPNILLALLIGVVPFAIINRFLLGWIIDDVTVPSVAYYVWNMSLLVFIEAPLATAGVTVFLGDAMFLQPPTMKKAFKSLWEQGLRLFVCQGILRGVVIAWLLALTLSLDDFMPGDMFLPLLAVGLMILRGVRPFINEIIVLERNPLRSSDPRVITVGRRSSKLHGANTGELLGRFMGMTLLAVLLTISISLSAWFVVGTFLNDWYWGPVMLHIFLPGAMWLVAGYMAVVRYLAYLDLRTRREGWAVELRLRAESTKLERQAY